ncbi:hypothetical protein PMYN1_Chma771 (chromatophore) [Paulinella micropora]|uniref:Uncharacterized protein n=2 Tax=Paulinella micropora TaxID=1928728 RepID=A0A5K7W4H8_9EUKA|nr:hypothetical protein PMYN1_Chma771 [Paulinella micropora]
MSKVHNTDSVTEPTQEKSSTSDIQDKPFMELLKNDCLSVLSDSIKESTKENIKLSTQETKMPILDITCSMLIGEFPDSRRFWICFLDNTFSGAKVFILANAGSEPSIIEPFLNGDGIMTTARPEASAIAISARIVQRLQNQQWLNVK